MSQVMLITVIANRAQIVVITLGTLPAYAEDRRLAAGVAHGALVLDTGRGTVQDSEIVCARASIVGGGAVVPDHDHLLLGLEIAHRPDVAFTAILQ